MASEVPFGRAEAEAMMEEYGYCKHSDCRALVIAAHGRGYKEAIATQPIAAAVLQQEAGEPVAHIRNGALMAIVQSGRLLMPDGSPVPDGPLYTTPQVSPPQARVPLTEERLKRLDFEAHRKTGCKVGSWAHLMTFARAIERAHLIGLETKD